jgi:hypothetical protein
MYDQETAALIRGTPFLEGLDRESLPDLLSKTFTQIAAARVRLRNTEGESPEELTPLVKTIRSLAYTNEALVSVSPNREDRRAAAFVAATAHQLCFNADKLIQGQPPSTFVNGYTISSNIAAMLLFMVAEATADAAEVSKSVKGNSNDLIEQELILSLKDLANGRLQSLTSRTAPKCK